jgi:hypothetical protein
MKRLSILALLIGLVAACGSAQTTPPGDQNSSSPPATSVVATSAVASSDSAAASSSPLPSTAPAQGGSAAAWCALVIDINTRAGYMVDKTYVNPPTAAMTKQVVLEALVRKDEILSVTPPEIHAAMAAELAYYQVLADWANQNGWDAWATNPSAPPPPADFLAAMGPLTSFQRAQRGIKFK